MRKHFPIERLGLIAALSVFATACQQVDQTLFEVEGSSATETIGAGGGTVSVASFSLTFPAGAFSGSVVVAVAPLIDAPFSSDAGTPVLGSAFSVTVPSGTTLLIPARVELKVDIKDLDEGTEVLMSVAVMRSDGSVVTFDGLYDITNGILIAEIDELGAIAAVISEDAIALESGIPPTLQGGAFPTPTVSPPGPTGPSLTSHGGIAFSASCAPDARQCFTSGLIRIWADDVVVQRLGEELFLLNPTVEAEFDFLTFDSFGVPTSVVGSIFIAGELRARLNSAVTSYNIDDGVTTGSEFPSPESTTVQISGSLMIIGLITSTLGGDDEVNEEVEFEITGIGTSEMLTIRVEAEVRFENEPGLDDTIGEIIAHIRLRR